MFVLYVVSLLYTIFLHGEYATSKVFHHKNQSKKPCTISKVFHHRIRSKKPSIELGTVVLYLDQDVLFKSSKSIEGDQKYYRYHIPAHLSTQAQAMLDKAQEIKGDYTVAFKKDTKGLQLTIGFNPSRVGIRVDKFNAITRHKGITFRLFDRKVLKRMQGHKPIIHIAHNDVQSVFIDCGHGGSDCGAIGCNSLREKDVNLQIGMELADQLKKKGLSVTLSRDQDTALAIDQRTALANQKNADLFISIHANSARAEVSGVETYYVEPTLFTRVDDTNLAVDESEKTFLYLKNKSKKSANLAYSVHSQLVNSVSSYGTLNRHVRNQVAQVLHGVTMPAILVEVGYMTHERESSLLSDRLYQKKIADGITHGVLSYLGRC